MLNYKKLVLFFSCCLIFATGYSQQLNNANEKSGDFMTSNGKIFVVMAVVVVIALGLFLYLINLDRKIKKLEKGDSEKT